MKNGIFIYDNFKKHSAGVQFFVPYDDKAYAAEKPCNGFGMIRYEEGSVYCGDIYFDGKRYNKIGFGRQDFLPSPLFNGYDELTGTRMAFYIGAFDYRQTDWIYGNGVMYYVDADNKPKYFIKGFFKATRKTGDYVGEFDYSSLAPGFTRDMEWDYDPWMTRLDARLNEYLREFKNAKSVENLFIGDSYFDIWLDRNFHDVFDGAHDLNVGIGGTKFSDWMGRFIDKLKDIGNPKRVVLNLGFNDIHSNCTAERVFDNYKQTLEQLREYFPRAEYVLLNVVKSPSAERCWAEEERFNAMTEETAAELGVRIVDMRSAIAKADNNGSMFDADLVHLNSDGYKVFLDVIADALKKG